MNIAEPRGAWHWLRGLSFLMLVGCNRQVDQDSSQPTSSVQQPPPFVDSAAQAAIEPVGDAEQAPSDPSLTTYELKMAPNDLMAVEHNPLSNDGRPATFIAGGEVYEGVRVRVRGAFSRSWPKKSLKIIFRQDKLF